MYFVSINAGAQVAIILLACGPCVVIVNCWDRFCTLGRAPCTKETLPDFREWCRVTRYPRVFRRLTSCQRTPRFWSVTFLVLSLVQNLLFLDVRKKNSNPQLLISHELFVYCWVVAQMRVCFHGNEIHIKECHNKS